MEKVRKYRDIKLVTTERRRNYLVSELNYHTIKLQKICEQQKYSKTQILMSKPVYLGWSILDPSKTAMYEFWYDYIKPKYG